MSVGRSNAAALLQKVNNQLRGERVPLKTKEEDELASYLSSLTAKTQQARAIINEEHDDLSSTRRAETRNFLVSSDHHSTSPANIASTSVASKYLKKKRQPESIAVSHSGKEEHCQIVTDSKDDVVIAKKAPATPIRSSQGASALVKAAALTNKIKERVLSSGLILQKHISEDSELEAGLERAKPGQSIGRDGHKIMKSRKTAAEEDRGGDKSPSPRRVQQSFSNEENTESPRRSKSKGEIIRTLGNVYVTSDEESLAEFIQGLSTSESSARRPQNLVAKRQKWQKSPSSPTRRSPSPFQVSRSPSPFKRVHSPLGKLSRSQSQDSEMLDSMASEMLENKHERQESTSSEDHFKMNLMDTASFLPASPSPPLEYKKTSRKGMKHQKQNESSVSVFKASSSNVFKKTQNKEPKEDKALVQKSKSSLFESLGVYMVDEMIGFDVDNNEAEKNLSDYSEIKTERSDYGKKTEQKHKSESEIITELSNAQKKVAPYQPYSSAASVSEKIGVGSSTSKRHKSDASDTEAGDYTESFESETIQSKSLKSKGKKVKSQKRRQTSKELSSSEGTRSQEHKLVVEEKRLGISTIDPVGGVHYWNTINTGIHVSGPYGLQYVDPAPVATHVISADALEALTAYSPNMMALHEMMKAQLDLVRNFVGVQQRIYQSCMDGLSYNFKYTTLEETKEYIRHHRKPHLTFEQALRLVEQEEGVQA